VVKTEGDGMFAVFANPEGAIVAAIELSRDAANRPRRGRRSVYGSASTEEAIALASR
jgi:class 3 adenylate cyclase